MGTASGTATGRATGRATTAATTSAEADWSSAFRRSTAHPAVFAVRNTAMEGRVVGWAAARSLPHRHKAYAFSAELDGWALLDGGVSRLRSRATGRLRSGVRVVGWSALRYLSSELGLTPPRRLLVGEPDRLPDDELRRLAESGWVAIRPPSHQAAVLVSYVDARGLADVAQLLVGQAPPVVPGSSGPARLGDET